MRQKDEDPPIVIKRRGKNKVSPSITIEERNMKLDYDPRPVVLEPNWAVKDTANIPKGKKQ